MTSHTLMTQTLPTIVGAGVAVETTRVVFGRRKNTTKGKSKTGGKRKVAYKYKTKKLTSKRKNHKNKRKNTMVRIDKVKTLI